ncbi:hypothetical protein C3L33_23112, partial [Rhododendron williamsianum]
MSRTGLAVSKGFSFRPLTVLELRGQKLELRLLKIAEQQFPPLMLILGTSTNFCMEAVNLVVVVQDVDEFIIGLPKSWDGKETEQSNKVRSIAGRFAVRAAER